MLETKSLPKNWENNDTKLNKSDVIDNLSTSDSAKALSANQGLVLWNAIQALSDGGSFESLQTLAMQYGKFAYRGTLNANQLSIPVGNKLHNFQLFLDGAMIDSQYFIADMNTGTINLKQAWADYSVDWVVLDELNYRIKFSYPTMQLLQGTGDSFKAKIEIDDVIEIQGTTKANDGDHRLVECKATQGLNGVQIATGKWLNEIPNTRIKTLADKVETTQGKLDTKMDKSGGTFGGNVGIGNNGAYVYLELKNENSVRKGIVQWSRDEDVLTIANEGGANLRLSKTKLETNLPLEVEGTNIKNEISKKADLGGADFTGAVKVPSYSYIKSHTNGVSELYLGNVGDIQGTINSNKTAKTVSIGKTNGTYLTLSEDKATINKPLDVDGRLTVPNYSGAYRLGDWASFGLFDADKTTRGGTIEYNFPNDYLALTKDNGAYISLSNNAVSTNKPFFINNSKVLTEEVGWKLHTKYIGKGVNYDTITESGWYIVAGNYENPNMNAPYTDQCLLQVWTVSGWTYQRAVSYYSYGDSYVRCFQHGVSNIAWGTNFNTGNCTIQKATNGYCKLANGMIMQWGIVHSPNANPNATYNFPIAFSNKDYKIVSSEYWDSPSGGWTGKAHCVRNVSGAQFSIGAWDGGGMWNWIAIGY